MSREFIIFFVTLIVSVSGAIQSPNCSVVHVSAVQWSVDCFNLSLNYLPPQSLLERVTVLSMRRNKLNSSVVFTALQNMKTLDVSFNELTTITNDMFNGLQTLQTLNLSYNHISVIHENFLDNSSSVVVLDLSGNTELAENDFNLFAALNGTLYRGLVRLGLSSIGLRTIKEDFFEFAFSLQELDLSQNRLRALPMFTNRLKRLDLSGNQLSEITGFPFGACVELEELIIENNAGLKEITHDAFHSLRKLKKLSLKGSKSLEHIPEGLLYRSPLRELSLVGCNLKTLSPYFKMAFKHIERLEVSDNPWQCSTELRWLNKLLPPNQTKELLCANSNLTWAEYYGVKPRHIFLRNLLLFLVAVVIVVFGFGMKVAYQMEMKRREEHSYFPLGKNNTFTNPVYVSTVV